MDHQTRLFQMLQSSTPAPGHRSPGTHPGTHPSHTLPLPPTHPGAPVQEHPSHPAPPTAGLLSPPGQTPTSPREPSPSPPPPSLQAVSLSDLFKNLQLPVGPPPSVSTPGASQASQGNAGITTATATGPGASVSPPAQGTTPDQRSRLLGMLTGLGGAGSGVGPANMPGAARMTPQGSAMTSMQGSAVGTPVGLGDKSFGAVGSPHHAPVVNHPTHPHPGPALQPTTTTLPRPTRGTPPIVPLQSTATGTSTASASSLQKPDGTIPGCGPGSAVGSVAGAAAKSPDPPKRGKFDFVSPFDFFEKPSPQGSSVSSPVVAAETKLPGVAAVTPVPAPAAQAPAPAPELTQVKQEPKEAPAQPELTKVKSIEKTLGRGRGVSPQTTTTQNEGQGQRGASPAVSDIPARAAEEASIGAGSGAGQAPTWLVENVTKGAQGKGPKTTSSHITIDLSKPNLDALVSSSGLVQVTPTTFMKADSVGYRKGRKVAITQAYVAYTVPKGKIRVIDNGSGARLLLQAQAKADEGPIVDLAVSGSLIAAIAHDLSLWIWRVPQYWEGDDPDVETLFAGATAGGPLGKAFKVEWVKKDGRQFVAVAGQDGVVVFDPAEHAGVRGLRSVSEVFAGLQVLKTDGAVVDVCLNQSHQAMGILSSSSYFTLFSIANLNRVWHRLLPSASPHFPPSSAQFLESNIIIGRAQNTHYDIVQITVDLAVLSSIRFLAPSPCPQELHYTNASYDGSEGILWIAPFARGSLYAFRYALKDQQPIKDVSLPHGPKVVAFDRVAEFPTAAVSSLAVCRKEVGEASEVFFATPKGFSSATVSLEALELLKGGSASAVVPGPAPAVIPTPLPTVIPPQQPAGTPTLVPTPQRPAAKHLKSTPVKVKSELPSDDESVTASTAGRGKRVGRNGSVAAGAGAAVPATQAGQGQEQGSVENGLTGEDLLKALKKTEDRLQNQFKQLLKNETTVLNARFDNLSGPALANDITAKVDKSVKASLVATVSAEIKKTVLPAAVTAIQSEIRAITSASIPSAISDALQTLPKDLERGLAPVVQRTVATMVQNSMERVVHESIQLTLVPALNIATAALSDRFMDELKSEMLQIRKELSPPRAEAQLSNEHMLKTMAASIAEMQKQLVSLNEQVAKSAAAAPAHPNGIAPPAAPPAVPVHPNQAPPPQQQQPFYPPPPSPAQLQDTFLAALGVQTVPATLQLVNEHSALTEYCLPVGQGAKSPLSQAVLLTLLHRLATALNELPPSHPLFGRVADWERRSVALLDPKDVNISGYTTRVLGVVQTLVGQVLNALQTRYAADPASQGHAVVLKQVADIVGYKMTL